MSCIARKNSSGQMVTPMLLWAIARVVMVFSVSRAILGLKNRRLKYWSTIPRIRLPRFNKINGKSWNAVMSAPWEKRSRISSALAPKSLLVIALGTASISRTSVSGVISTSSSMIG